MGNQIKQQNAITVSPSYRWLENAHILLWLMKDTCWALEWKPGGIIMIFPTVGMAFYILWRSRAVRTELFHNIAVCFWIIANSVWMLGEFYELDTRPYAAGAFITGLAVLVVYYLAFFRKDNAKEKQYALSMGDEPAQPSVANPLQANN
jgi:hypothetical protein